jgi:AraC family transcriptional regulator, activator of mtrCDE
MIDHPALDTLHRMLRLHQLRAAFFANPTLCDRWQLRFEGEHRLTFHHVQSGQCTLQLDNASARTIQLSAGDLAVIPQLRVHVLSSLPTSQLGHDATRLLCGAIDVERDDRSPLLDALPSSIVIRAQDTAGQSSLRRVLELMTDETADQSNACQLVLDKLAGALFAMVLRHHIQTARPSHGLFAALNDSHLQPVLSAVHADVGRRWSLREVSGLANMSRSAFADHFRGAFAMSFHLYLMTWRMSHAAIALRDARRSVAQIADSLGYTTEASFRRAFKRHFGIGPGRVRRDERARSRTVMRGIEPSASGLAGHP